MPELDRRNPMQALVFAAVFNGVIAVLLIWFIVRIAASADTMGSARSSPARLTAEPVHHP